MTAEYQALAVCNPFRYRGYAYDRETGLYYLQTRYYGAVPCRFLNADAVVASGTLLRNSFAYCSNNAPRRVNTSRYAWESLKNNVSDWWENKVTPWLNHAKEAIAAFWNETKTFIKHTVQARQQADIISAQITYNAACIIGNWFSENWKVIADWGTAIAGAGTTAYAIVQTVLPALPAIPFVGQIALFGAGIWGIGRLAGWF